MTRLTLRTRLTLWYTLALIVVLCGFCASLLWQQHRLSIRRLDTEIGSVATTLSRVVQAEFTEHDDIKVAADEACATLSSRESLITVFVREGDQRTGRWNQLAASWNGFSVPGALQTTDGIPAIWTEGTGPSGWRVHTRAGTFSGQATGGPGNARLMLLVAKPLSDMYREQTEVLEAMQVAIPLILLLAGGGGYWLSSVGLRPIAQMADRAAQLSPAGTADLGHADRSDELGQFARAFNGLVARLRSALRTQQQFMADASHELRTPVSVVRAATDVALNRPHRDESEYRETLGIVGNHARRLGRLVDNMLVLARADAGGYPLSPVEHYLDEIVGEACRALAAISAERRVTIHQSETVEIPFRGDEDLLRRLVLNVVQNAVQHSSPGGVVNVSMSNGQTIDIRVADTGSGIPREEHERIFDRFVQLDSARRGESAGLGLPIARWIAETHGGSVIVESSSAAGSTFRISLPRQTEGAPSA